MQIEVEVRLSTALGRSGTSVTADAVRMVSRTAAGKFLVTYIRHRIQDTGKGAGGQQLLGYSTRPLKVSKGTILRKKEPTDGLPKFYKGGYAEYRTEVGLQNKHFAFTNTGFSFNVFDVDVGDAAANTPIKIGFTHHGSRMAARYAVMKRPEMFGVDKRELDKALEVFIDSLTSVIWKDVFDDATAQTPAKVTTP